MGPVHLLALIPVLLVGCIPLSEDVLNNSPTPPYDDDSPDTGSDSPSPPPSSSTPLFPSPTEPPTPSRTQTPTVEPTPAVTFGPTPFTTHPPVETPTPSPTPLIWDTDQDGVDDTEGDCDDLEPHASPSNPYDWRFDRIDNDCLWDVDEESDLTRSSTLGRPSVLEFGHRAVSTDLDVDGILDLLVVNYSSADGMGSISIYYGGVQRLLTGEGDPLEPDAVLWGEQAYSGFGDSLDAEFDVSSDGRPDILVGAPFWDLNEYKLNFGRSYLFISQHANGTDGRWKGTLSAKDRAINLEAEAAADELGTSVSLMPDINCNGQREVVLGAPAHTSSSGKGRVYVMDGTWNQGPGTVILVSSTPFQLEGFGATFGASVLSPGDVNDDGCADLLVGAPDTFRSASDPGAGSVSLFLGSPHFDAESVPAATFWGEDVDELGNAMARAGDIDQDGRSDFLLGSRHYDNDAGLVALFLGGRVDTDEETSYEYDDAELVIVGDEPESGLGGASTFVVVGDTTGDTLPELLVGAPDYYSQSSSHTDAGAAFLFEVPNVDSSGRLVPGGSALGAHALELQLSDANVHFIGESFDRAGACVSATGDGDGDMLNDFLIGAVSRPLAPDTSGIVYVVRGMSTP